MFSQNNTFPASGNVGIGTTTPGKTLEVLGTVKADTLLISANGFITTSNNLPLIFLSGGIQIGRLEFDNVTGNAGQGNRLANVFLGFNTGINNTTGKRNVAIGTHALKFNETGRAAVAIGASALEKNTSGEANTAIGEKSLPNNTTGSSNVAIGHEAIFANTIGNENIGIGTAATGTNLTGNNNIGIGFGALYGNITGNYNIGLGRFSLSGNSSGDYNTALGYGANTSVDGLSNATVIGANAIVSASNSLILGNNANVGIGTSAPAEKLEVAGIVFSTFGGFKFPDGTIQTTAFTPNTIDALAWQINGNGGTNAGLEFIGTTDVQDLVFKTNNEEHMRISSTGNHPGNVGIGTDQPEKKLHVATSHTICNTCSDSHWGMRLEDRTYETSLNQTTTTVWDFEPKWGGLYVKKPNMLSSLAINASGNVGIGTENPLVKLQAHGSISIYDPTPAPGASDISLYFGQANTQGNTRGKWGIQYVAPQTLGHQGGLNFWIPALPGNNFGNNYLFLADNGNIGIGTPTPEAKLHIEGNINNGKVSIGVEAAKLVGNYRLYVADGIMTEHCRVALKSSSEWADYVFAQDYKLMPLDQLKKFIERNNHLPDVPSADYVVKHGLDVAQTDAMLLKKIEELTLYILELKKELDILKSEK